MALYARCIPRRPAHNRRVAPLATSVDRGRTLARVTAALDLGGLSEHALSPRDRQRLGAALGHHRASGTGPLRLSDAVTRLSKNVSIGS